MNAPVTLPSHNLLSEVEGLQQQVMDISAERNALLERVALLEKSDAANEELAVLAIGERDGYKQQLLELLSVLHRDGGHHTEARGITLSCLDARDKYYQLLTELEELRRECGSLLRRYGVVP